VLKMLVNFLLAVLSGVLLVVIHPNFNLTLLAPFALAPLLIALAREPRPKWRWALGHTCGIVFWGGICYWIQYVMAVHGALGEAGGWGAFALFALLAGMGMGGFGLLAAPLMPHWFAIPAVAALWVVQERIPCLFGFMWLKLGNAAIAMSVPMRVAAYTGVYGVSFLFALLSCAVAVTILRRSRSELGWAALVLLLFLFPEAPDYKDGVESAVVLQPNLPEDKQWRQDEVDSMQLRLAKETLQSALAAGEPKPALLLWPEAPAPLYYYDDARFRDRANELARVTRTHFLFGTIGYTAKSDPLNSALMISAAGTPEGRYDKINLVPFGEYVPAPFWFVNKITQEIGTFQPGERVVTFQVEGHRVGAFICYESALPQLVRQFRGDVLLNLSNDGYFGHTAAREQHLSLVRMRAAENQRWIVRATNDGITAAVDPSGRVAQQWTPFTEQAGRLKFSFLREASVYTLHGDWFVWFCAMISAAALVGSQWPHYSGRPQKTEVELRR
jgi:apolipoprotein N-acyltransferase